MKNSLENCNYIDISAKEAWQMLNDYDNCFLVDVRTTEEWQSSGWPNLAENNAKLIKCSLSNTFENDLSKLISNQDSKVLFICESGYRSKQAALFILANGYNQCYNVVGGAQSWKECKLLWSKV